MRTAAIKLRVKRQTPTALLFCRHGVGTPCGRRRSKQRAQLIPPPARPCTGALRDPRLSPLAALPPLPSPDFSSRGDAAISCGAGVADGRGAADPLPLPMHRAHSLSWPALVPDHRSPASRLSLPQLFTFLILVMCGCPCCIPSPVVWLHSLLQSRGGTEPLPRGHSRAGTPFDSGA